MKYRPSIELVPDVIAGAIPAVARLLTRAESRAADCRPALDAIFAAAGRAHVVGITGVPGAGKSTLVSALTAEIRRTGRKVAVIAVDPSSPYSGGAILGDRIRMLALAGDPGVFVRSVATRGAMGGLSRCTLEAVDVLDAAGYDTVLIETVGVGQDEIDVARAAHTTVVVSAPGLGDEIQAIKAGVLEIADIHVVSKFDRPDAARTMLELNGMLGLGPELKRHAGWDVPVIGTSSEKGQGIAELVDTIDKHWQSMHDSGEIGARRSKINERRLIRAAEEIVYDRFTRELGGKATELLERLNARTTSPHTAAEDLLEAIQVHQRSQ